MQSIHRKFEDIIFRNENNTGRFTQDSPVYPSVWMEYLYQFTENGQHPFENRIDLILTPHRNFSSSELFIEIKKSFSVYGQDYIKDFGADWGLSTNGETVAVKCNLAELLYCLLPHTRWFKDYILKKDYTTDVMADDSLFKAHFHDKKNTINEELRWLKQVIGFLVEPNQDKSASKKELETSFEKVFDRFPENYAMPAVQKLWSVSINRKARVSIHKSVPATKADAARRLFDLDTSRITWAVLDTGIDAKHSAFNTSINDAGKKFVSRVIETYDFTRFRDLIADLSTTSGTNKDVERMIGQKPNKLMGPTSTDHNRPLSKKNKIKSLRDVQKALKSGRMLDWSVLAPILRIPHDEHYIVPRHPHGTHVAGIIGAGNNGSVTDNPRPEGMCPNIRLYDIRVLNDQGTGEEFNISAAIQFIRWLNRQKDLLVIHGINLSLSIPHEVESYACGRTPVCESCNRLFAEGTVIVTAAGNMGQAVYESPTGRREQGFRTVNITDPGNAENVITVGATHSNKPHTYGVSYFSSRGPTGDGRLKPDIVAPGEKIRSTVPGNNDFETMDGTSMAAPHVSGAAAILLAKYRELIGNPEKIKETLCGSATDLNREKYFQGNGMLDVLRAIQSI